MRGRERDYRDIRNFASIFSKAFGAVLIDLGAAAQGKNGR